MLTPSALRVAGLLIDSLEARAHMGAEFGRDEWLRVGRAARACRAFPDRGATAPLAMRAAQLIGARLSDVQCVERMVLMLDVAVSRAAEAARSAGRGVRGIDLCVERDDAESLLVAASMAGLDVGDAEHALAEADAAVRITAAARALDGAAGLLDSADPCSNGWLVSPAAWGSEDGWWLDLVRADAADAWARRAETAEQASEALALLPVIPDARPDGWPDVAWDLATSNAEGAESTWPGEVRPPCMAMHGFDLGALTRCADGLRRLRDASEHVGGCDDCIRWFREGFDVCAPFRSMDADNGALLPDAIELVASVLAGARNPPRWFEAMFRLQHQDCAVIFSLEHYPNYAASGLALLPGTREHMGVLARALQGDATPAPLLEFGRAWKAAALIPLGSVARNMARAASQIAAAVAKQAASEHEATGYLHWAAFELDRQAGAGLVQCVSLAQALVDVSIARSPVLDTLYSRCFDDLAITYANVQTSDVSGSVLANAADVMFHRGRHFFLKSGRANATAARDAFELAIRLGNLALERHAGPRVLRRTAGAGSYLCSVLLQEKRAADAHHAALEALRVLEAMPPEKNDLEFRGRLVERVRLLVLAFRSAAPEQREESGRSALSALELGIGDAATRGSVSPWLVRFARTSALFGVGLDHLGPIGAWRQLGGMLSVATVSLAHTEREATVLAAIFKPADTIQARYELLAHAMQEHAPASKALSRVLLDLLEEGNKLLELTRGSTAPAATPKMTDVELSELTKHVSDALAGLASGSPEVAMAIKFSRLGLTREAILECENAKLTFAASDIVDHGIGDEDIYERTGLQH